MQPQDALDKLIEASAAMAERIRQLESQETITAAIGVRPFSVADKPPAGIKGRLIYITNNNRTAYDDGSIWRYVFNNAPV